MNSDLELQEQNLESDSVKIVLLGDSGVGKTSLAQRFVDGIFSTPNSTIAVSYFSKKICINHNVISAKIWDTSGQERFRSLVPLYYRGASIAILVFDITSLKSFESLKTWVNELNRNVSRKIISVIVANKSDLHEKRQVPKEIVINYANSIGAKLFEASALNGEGVQELFVEACSELEIEQEFPNNSSQKNQKSQNPKNWNKQVIPSNFKIEKNNLNSNSNSNSNSNQNKTKSTCC
ncbi:ras-related protein rab-5c [Anaeramoeba ignava]|uniref:Ras-related protein rab-5c n=1 Tax=Anaeramoeba ignava TaxID=1746090 RepID=A0A9Q0LDJ0_ANAIG|nr:ras-related protein rab-5c [Anaeramoeba ignava]